MGLLADELVARFLDDARQWPLEWEADIEREIAGWVAFRESDRTTLRTMAGRAGHAKITATTLYMVDPMPPRISGAFATLLFGREPTVNTANDADQDRMDEMLRLNRWHSRLLREEENVSSEGERWWRWVSDPARFQSPVLTWHSRMDVVPYYVNQQLRACAFKNRLRPAGDRRSRWRHFEVHDASGIRNVLYRGTDSKLGRQVPLTLHPDVANLPAEWEHDLGMLAGRIVNIEGSDPTLGVSDYRGLEDFFYELNECLATGRGNRGLAAEKRIVAPREALDERGDLPPGRVLAAEQFDSTAGGGQNVAQQFTVLEFNYQASELVAWTEHVTRRVLGQRGITVQFVGMDSGNEATALSGTARRIQLMPSTNEADRRRRPWADDLDGILMLGQQLDALTDETHGFSTAWRQPADPPSIEFASSLPVDANEEATRIATLRAADSMSIERAVREQHPEWDDEAVTAEVELIRSERQAAVPATLRAGRPAAATDSSQNGAGESVTVDQPEASTTG